MMNKIKESCKKTVADVMNRSGMDTTCLVSIADIAEKGAIVFMVLIGIAALCFFGFGLTALAIGICVYAVVDILVINVGCSELSNEVLENYWKITEELEQEINDLKKELF